MKIGYLRYMSQVGHAAACFTVSFAEEADNNTWLALETSDMNSVCGQKNTRTKSMSRVWETAQNQAKQQLEIVQRR